MGAAGDMGADQCRFCVEYIRIDLLQLVSALVVIGVTGGCGEASGADTVFPECCQNLGLVVFSHLVNFFKTFFQPGNGCFAVLIDGRGDAHAFI